MTTTTVTTMDSCLVAGEKTSPTLQPIHSDQIRDLYSSVPSGVAAVCALIGGQPDGMAASSLVPVSLDPPLVSFCVQNGSRTWSRVRTAARIGVSVLARDQSGACTALAAREGDRFAELDWHAQHGGGVFITGAAAYLDCVVESEVPGGDHRIVLLRVVAGGSTDCAPIIFHNSRFGSISENDPTATE